jgi:Tfp pilus assembly protein FimT
MKNKGFSIIELLMIVGFISILLVMGMTVSSKFAERRSIDDITYKISSSLSRTKLQAARSGVEYETDLKMEYGILTINTYRGSSNRDSDFSTKLEPTEAGCLTDPPETGCPSNTLAIDIKEDFIVVSQDATDPINKSFQFNPGGTLGVAGTINIKPSSDGTNINKCGKIVVHSLGRIRTAVGNWDGNNCKTIGDLQENETESED